MPAPARATRWLSITIGDGMTRAGTAGQIVGTIARITRVAPAVDASP